MTAYAASQRAFYVWPLFWNIFNKGLKLIIAFRRYKRGSCRPWWRKIKNKSEAASFLSFCNCEIIKKMEKHVWGGRSWRTALCGEQRKLIWNCNSSSRCGIRRATLRGCCDVEETITSMLMLICSTWLSLCWFRALRLIWSDHRRYITVFHFLSFCRIKCCIAPHTRYRQCRCYTFLTAQVLHLLWQPL